MIQNTESWALVIPVYNEGFEVANTVRKIHHVLKRVAKVEVEIIVVNDGSTDNTAEILTGIPGVTVLTHGRNYGYGASLRTALDYTSRELILITDADGTYPLDLIPRLMEDLRAGAAMVVGARHGQGISQAPFRRLARWCLRHLVYLLTRVYVPDLNSGMRAFRRSIYAEFRHLLPAGFSFTTTITVASLYCRYRVEYVPIEYLKRKGKSHINPVRDFVNFTVLILRLASYFEPMKFFLPISMVVFGLGILRATRDFILLGYLGSLSVIMMLMAIQFFLTGIVADVIVRRSGAALTSAALLSARVHKTRKDESTPELAEAG